MGLEDAISKARQQQDLEDKQKRQEEEQRRRDQQRLGELLKEAAERLLPHRGETLHRMRSSTTGAFRQNGRRYQQVSGHFCWVIKDLDPHSAWGRSVMLLVLDGSTPYAVRAVLNLKSGKAGQYVTSLDLEPVGRQHYTERGFMAFLPGAWIDELEKDLGAAIARYQRD